MLTANRTIRPSAQKQSGAYYTPDPVAASLLSWAIRCPEDRLLDPSCGDGRFIRGHRNSVGIEQDPRAAAHAMEVAPWALVHEGDFFAWASNTEERFDCTAGNPPFIRYQTFKGPVRERALNLCAKLGVAFSGLASSWAPYLVATASLLRPGGRMSFVVPAEIGHAPYASPLLEYLVDHFETVQIVAVRDKLFPDLSEDCWLLHAEGFADRISRNRSGLITSAGKFFPSGGRAFLSFAVSGPSNPSPTKPSGVWRSLPHHGFLDGGARSSFS
jgi:adenine-specific DNA methylase